MATIVLKKDLVFPAGSVLLISGSTANFPPYDKGGVILSVNTVDKVEASLSIEVNKALEFPELFHLCDSGHSPAKPKTIFSRFTAFLRSLKLLPKDRSQDWCDAIRKSEELRGARDWYQKWLSHKAEVAESRS